MMMLFSQKICLSLPHDLIFWLMKKVFFILIAALMSLGAQAQSVGYMGTIDETDLIGTWDVSSVSGTYPYNRTKTPTQFKFSSDGSFTEIRDYTSAEQFRAFFITNGNKLHINSGYNNFNAKAFIIEDYYTNSYMTLKSLDRTFTMHLNKTTSSVNAARYEVVGDSAMHNLQGIKIDSPEGIYIQNGKKFVAK